MCPCYYFGVIWTHSKTYAFLKGRYYGRYLVMSILTIYGEYENNMEIYKLTEGADIVRFIKTQRIKWLGHIQRMDQARRARKLLD